MASVYEVAFGHETLSIETGKLAEQANGSVVVRYGDVMMLVTVCAAQSAREGVDFLPLTCLLYTSPSPRDATLSRMPSSA